VGLIILVVAVVVVLIVQPMELVALAAAEMPHLLMAEQEPRGQPTLAVVVAVEPLAGLVALVW
jgi:hypothetical protein